MLEIRPAPVAESAENLRQAANVLARSAGLARDAQRALESFSYMEEPLRKLRDDIRRMEEKEMQAVQMGRALEQALDEYLRNEKRILINSEMTEALPARRFRR